MSNLIKSEIRVKFNKAQNTYDQYCFVQNEVCDRALKLLSRHTHQADCIADFACGTGESTKKLIECIKYNECYGVDFAESLLQIAKCKLSSKVKFIAADLDYFLFGRSCFNLIFSNMALQWSSDLLTTFQNFNKYLFKNGVLAFSIPINNNFPEIVSGYKLKVPMHNNIIKALTDTNFELIDCDLETIIEYFKNQIEALKSLKNTGTNYNKRQDRSCKIGLSGVNTKMIFINPVISQLTYKIGIYLARKR